MHRKFELVATIQVATIQVATIQVATIQVATMNHHHLIARSLFVISITKFDRHFGFDQNSSAIFGFDQNPSELQNSTDAYP